MSRHRQREDDPTTILPATVEQLAALEREPARAGRSRRPVVIVAAATVALTAAATGWAVARPTPEPVVPPTAWASGSARGYVDGFGAVSPSAEPTSRSLPRQPVTRPSSPGASPSAAPSSSGSAPLAPAGPAAAALVTGSRRSLRAANGADRYVQQRDGLASVVDVTAGSPGALRQAVTFTVVAGLADGGCFSFVGVDGFYLRHRDYRIRHERSDGSALFREDATFCARPGALPGSVYLESHNYRDHYIHLRGDELWIDRWRDQDSFDRDCTFVVTGAWG